MKLPTILSAILVAASSVSGIALKVGAPSTAPGIVEKTYIINFPPGTDGTGAVKDYFKSLNVNYTERVSINTNLGSFVSVNVPGTFDQNAHLPGVPGAISFSNVRELKRPELQALTSNEPPQLELIHSITGVNDARNYLGLTGKGVKVAVIDTGVYYLHPALGGGFGPGFKVANGYDFVGDNWHYTNPPQPDNDPLDNCSEESHGTHVAGIVAGDARNITDPSWAPTFAFSGAAPEATIYAYRVFSCSGSASNDIITAAILRAAADGADIISLSLGGGPSYADEPQAIAASLVSQAGHFVISAAGNDGAAGPFVTGNPSNARSGLSIASFDNVATPAPYVTVDGVKSAYSLGSLSTVKFTEGQLLDVVVNNLLADVNNVQDDGVKPLVANVKGKAALIRFGNDALGGSQVRCGSAYAAGATACILYSVDDTLGGIYGSPNIPSLLITNSAAKALIADVTAGKPAQVIVSQKQFLNPIPTAGTLSSFSSPGLDNELWFKPDLGGIGGQVYSTISPHAAKASGLKENYAVYSGTSMATPYVSGVGALILQAQGKIQLSEFRARLQNTASLKPVYGTNVTHNPSYQGAGLVNAFTAASIKTLVVPSAIALNDTVNLKTVSFTITNKYKFSQNYYLNNNPAATVNAVLPGDDFTQDYTTTTFTGSTPASLQFSGDDGYGSPAWDFKLVRVPAGKSVTVSFKVTPPETDPSLYAVYGGYISIVNDYDDNVITVPYAGVSGDWKNRPVWSRKSPSLGQKWLSQLVPSYKSTSTGLYKDLSFTPLAANSVINGTVGAFALAIPAITSRFATIKVEFQGLDLSELKKLGITGNSAYVNLYDLVNGGAAAGYFPLLQRTTFSNGQSVSANTVYGWDGTAVLPDLQTVVQLPAGSYKVIFSALKNFGDVNKAADFDVLTTPVFNLVY
ncbi:subtilisin-like protein [Rhizoclosmatium globosum]|uniref:Subtilisin-like protein n=1 Tax=Rhizoclosmatium globosum TaxID=329046 RepID=A0A1Y2D3H9_9FUNG|nr:subtilisin-like protein [Rhizoclosmatium globosum]|eukprot:ORY53841.1 subtilisin-like protein [Rhizoclosmatium globosum]